MKPSELLITLKAAIMDLAAILITGAPGCGKTDIGIQAALDCGIAEANIVVSHPVVDDPTDVKGFPMRVKDEMTFAPIGDIKTVLDATEPTLWFIDDIGQALPSMQAAYMRPLLTRKIGNRPIPDCVSVIAATNRRADKAGVSGILEPVKSRFVSIVELQADIQAWSAWAYSKKVPTDLIAFLRLRSDLLSAFTPTADMTNSPSPRTWANLARIERWNLPREIQHEAMAGAVGEGAATEYLAFKKMVASMVSIDAILADPTGAKMPSNPSECYAVSTGLAARANDKTIARIGTYANRLANADKGEFAALIIRDSIRRVPAIANTKEYVQLMCGPLGSLISGQSIS